MSEPKSLGRVAFEAWLSGDVVTEVEPGRWAMRHGTAADVIDRRWATLPYWQKATWERIGKACSDHALEAASGTICVEVE